MQFLQVEGVMQALPMDSISAGHEVYYKLFKAHSSKIKEWNFDGAKTH